MKRTRERLIEDIECYTKLAENYTKEAEKARKELEELEEQELSDNNDILIEMKRKLEESEAELGKECERLRVILLDVINSLNENGLHGTSEKVEKQLNQGK